MSHGPLAYCTGFVGSDRCCCLYERNIKRWKTLDSVGLAPYKKRMASRGTSGTVHVCRATRCLQRCSREGVPLSLHSFLSSMVCSIVLWLLEGLVSVRRLRVMPFPFATEDIRLVGMWKSAVDVGEVIILFFPFPYSVRRSSEPRITAAADDVRSEISHGVTGGAQSRLCTLGVGEVCRAFGVRECSARSW